MLTLLLNVKSDFTPGYVVGTIIALLILGYLLYALFKPEKF